MTTHAGASRRLGPRSPSPRRPAAAGELAIEAQAGYFDMAATNSAKAVFGSSGGVHLRRRRPLHLLARRFVSAGARTFSKDGERVFVAAPSGPVQKLGFPLSVAPHPDLRSRVGYRFRNGQDDRPLRRRRRRDHVLQREERRRRREPSTTTARRRASSARPGSRSAAAPSLRRPRPATRRCPSAVGLGGVSKVYGEDDLGGSYVIGKLDRSLRARRRAKRGVEPVLLVLSLSRFAEPRERPATRCSPRRLRSGGPSRRGCPRSRASARAPSRTGRGTPSCPRNASICWRASVPTVFSIEPPRPIRMPFWLSRSTRIAAWMRTRPSSSLNELDHDARST